MGESAEGYAEENRGGEALCPDYLFCHGEMNWFGVCFEINLSPSLYDFSSCV